MERDGIRAVLFDVGGPLDTEELWEQLVDRDIRAALAENGVPCTDTEYERAAAYAVESFAPDAYGAIIWRLCGGDVELARRVEGTFRSPEWRARRASGRGGIEARPGVDGVLRALRDRGLPLGLAANQPAQMLEELDRVGFGSMFEHREMTGHHGFRKPDVRLFLRACEGLGVVPEETIMVGDRIDNDIAPDRAGACAWDADGAVPDRAAHLATATITGGSAGLGSEVGG